MIENKQKQVEKITRIGIVKINKYNQLDTEYIVNIAKFTKGLELGSANYIESAMPDSVPYLRVGDLLDSSNCVYVESNLANINTNEEDIVIAFDGAPGRNSTCLYGIRSSGLYRIDCENSYKGIVFFEINSDLNQSIIKNNSQGTTILHASKSINYLRYALISDHQKQELNIIFNQIIILKKEIKKLKIQKQLLLNKYFTNQ